MLRLVDASGCSIAASQPCVAHPVRSVAQPAEYAIGTSLSCLSRPAFFVDDLSLLFSCRRSVTKNAGEKNVLNVSANNKHAAFLVCVPQDTGYQVQDTGSKMLWCVRRARYPVADDTCWYRRTRITEKAIIASLRRQTAQTAVSLSLFGP